MLWLYGADVSTLNRAVKVLPTNTKIIHKFFIFFILFCKILCKSVRKPVFSYQTKRHQNQSHTKQTHKCILCYSHNPTTHVLGSKTKTAIVFYMNYYFNISH